MSLRRNITRDIGDKRWIPVFTFHVICIVMFFTSAIYFIVDAALICGTVVAALYFVYTNYHTRVLRWWAARGYGKNVVIWQSDRKLACPKIPGFNAAGQPISHSSRRISIGISGFPYDLDLPRIQKLIGYFSGAGFGFTVFIVGSLLARAVKKIPPEAPTSDSAIKAFTNYANVEYASGGYEGYIWYDGGTKSPADDITSGCALASKVFGTHPIAYHHTWMPQCGTAAACKQLKMQFVVGDVRPIGPASWKIGTVLERVKPGSIVILRDGPGLLSMLKVIIPSLRQRHYKIVKISELLDPNSAADQKV